MLKNSLSIPLKIKSETMKEKKKQIATKTTPCMDHSEAHKRVITEHEIHLIVKCTLLLLCGGKHNCYIYVSFIEYKFRLK